MGAGNDNGDPPKPPKTQRAAEDAAPDAALSNEARQAIEAARRLLELTRPEPHERLNHRRRLAKKDR